ncbi:hypothetical protein KC953_02220 [Candidatus Saccharibacteria bacterium]|nr:hypothetical protein [Candidatus Saccharibacteria bacterium]
MENDFNDFLQNHQELVSEVNEYNSLPLDAKSKDDPFFIAQMLQKDLTQINPEHRGIVAKFGLDTLEDLVSESITENRLAIGAFRLCALDDSIQQSLNMKGYAFVSGDYSRFVFGKFQGEESYALQLTSPYFIRPEFDGAPGNLLRVDSLAIPVSGIDHWGLLPRDNN